MGLLLGMLNLAKPAHAQSVPTIISHQGRLLNASNQPVTTNVSVVFAIYDAASAGNQVWTETQSITPDSLGFYETFLGGVTALPSTLPNPSYLQITVQSETLSPRLQFGSVPFAQKAGSSRVQTYSAQRSPTQAPVTVSGSNPPTWNAIPGLSTTFSVSRSSTLDINYSGTILGYPTAGVHTFLFVDGNPINCPGGVADSCNPGYTPPNWVRTSNVGLVDVGSGSHTVEIRFICYGPGSTCYIGEGFLVVRAYPQ